MSETWRDQLAGARMQVDQQFRDRLDQSRFTNQEWGLIMTAIEFEIERADDPDQAQLVADTSKLDQIVPELDRVQEQMGGAMRPTDTPTDTGGLFGKLKQYLGGLSTNGSEGSDDERMAAAAVLVEEYTDSLQTHLEERGRWEEIRQIATGSA